MRSIKVLGGPLLLPPAQATLQTLASQPSLADTHQSGPRSAQVQATLKDKCTAEWVLILKSCVAGSMLAQALEASQHPHVLVEASLRKFSGGALSQYL